MTKRERQLKSMLNYYEIDMEPKRDEKMSKSEQKDFLNRLNSAYEAYVVQEVVKKLKDKLKDNQPEKEESDDPFFDSLKKETGDEPNPFGDFNLADSLFGFPFGGSPLNNKFGLNPEIEKLIAWISDTLYSADHNVVIRESEDGMTTNIELRKLKKRGGKKK